MHLNDLTRVSATVFADVGHARPDARPKQMTHDGSAFCIEIAGFIAEITC